jgi:hypothetical protein
MFLEKSVTFSDLLNQYYRKKNEKYEKKTKNEREKDHVKTCDDDGYMMNTKYLNFNQNKSETSSKILLNVIIDKCLIYFLEYYIISVILMMINFKRKYKILHLDLFVTVTLFGIFSFIEINSNHAILLVFLLFIFTIVNILNLHVMNKK